jgi:uncharacterized membrane protein
MAGTFLRRAMRCTRRISVLTLLVLALLATAAYAVFAAGGKPDFSISASPVGQTVTQGQSTTFAVTIAPGGGFTGNVSLSTSTLPAGVAGMFVPSALSVTSSQPVTGNLSLTTSGSTPAGTYQIVVTGTGSASGKTVSDSTTVYLIVQSPKVGDFSLSATPSTQNVSQGSQAQYTIAIDRTNFTSGMSLSVYGLPNSASASFSPVNPSTTSSATMTVSVANSSATGTYSLTIVGTSGGLTRSTGVTLTVQRPAKSDFSLAAAPASQTVLQHGQTSYAISIDRSNFTGGVQLSVSGLPSGAATSSTPANPVTGSSATLTVAAGVTTPAGTYSLTVTGTSGSLIHSVGVTLVVQASDFSVSASPSGATVLQGDYTSFGVTIARTSFTDGVTLSVSGLPSGATASFSPANPNTTGSATVTVDTTAGTATGSYSLSIVGTSGPRTHSTPVTLVVQQTVAFSISGDLTSAVLSPGSSPQALNVSISNPYPTTLLVSNLGVTVRSATSQPGCSGTANYTVSQYSGGYPLSIPANSTRTLSQLVADSSKWPTLGMLDLPTNQDSCKGATITLDYTGMATK